MTLSFNALFFTSLLSSAGAEYSSGTYNRTNNAASKGASKEYMDNGERDVALATRKLKKKKSKKNKECKPTKDDNGYEVWASDQSNSVDGQSALGVKGSYLWIYDSVEIETRLDGCKGDDGEKQVMVPLSCSPGMNKGPCDVFDVFPRNLEQVDAGGELTGHELKDLEGFGRLHGMLPDKSNRYVTANMFAPGGAYVGIIDTRTKEAVALFRGTKFTMNGSEEGKRSVHMSFWSEDGTAIFVDNLHGKAIERINVKRDQDGTITSAAFDRSATVGLGKGMEVEEEATFFIGPNAFGRNLLGGLVGDYGTADLDDLTPNGFCKEDGCDESELNSTGRANNVPICPIASKENKLYVTLGSGGLFVLDITSTPMKIVGEYDPKTINGAGCGGYQAGTQMFVNSGVSASGSGFDQSTFTVYSLPTDEYEDSNNEEQNKMNHPAPKIVFKDETNTKTIGNVDGIAITLNDSGQIPGTTTRRDSHGMASDIKERNLHVFDRVRNVAEVFNVKKHKRRDTYDLTGPACQDQSVSDDPKLPSNDPAPDLFASTPDGKHFMIAFRGPAPVSVGHSAQGSCPGIGIVKLSKKGKSGKLVDVIRTTNVVDDAPLPNIVGGVQYDGTERSDVHGVTVIAKRNR